MWRWGNLLLAVGFVVVVAANLAIIQTQKLQP
jgi:hypothetical protein